jgi:hypothetical protein
MAHRIAMMLMGAEVQDGQAILHTCDNSPCCNPEHLRIGTQNDNIQDMVSKGRARGAPHKGVSNSQAKLDAEAVLTIRQQLSEGRSQSEIAKNFGVSQTNVSQIKRRKTWGHL